IVVAGREIARRQVLGTPLLPRFEKRGCFHHKNMRAFACFVRVPMAIQKPIKDQCLHLGMFSLFFRIAIRPIESCTIALGINIRSEENVLAVWRPEFAATFSVTAVSLWTAVTVPTPP